MELHESLVLWFLLAFLACVSSQTATPECQPLPTALPPPSWCNAVNPYIIPNLLSETQYPEYTRDYFCENDSSDAECKNVAMIGTTEQTQGGKVQRSIIVGLHSGEIIYLDFNTYAIRKLAPENVNHRINKLERTPTNDKFLVSASLSELLFYNSNETDIFVVANRTYNAATHRILELKMMRYENETIPVALIQRLDAPGEYELEFMHHNTLLYTWKIKSPVSLGTLRMRITEHRANVMNSGTFKIAAGKVRVILLFSNDQEIHVVEFQNSGPLELTLGDGSSPLSLVYKETQPNRMITYAELIPEPVKRPGASAVCGNWDSYNSMNMYVNYGIWNTVTQKGETRIRSVPEFAYFNTAEAVSPMNPMQRPISYSCNTNENYHVPTQTCVIPLEYVISLGEAKPDMAKVRFMDLFQLQGVASLFNSDGSVNNTGLCALSASTDLMLFQACLAAVDKITSCDVQLVKNANANAYYKHLFATSYHNILYVIDSTNKMRLYALQPVWNTAFELSVVHLNELVFVGKIIDVHISSNGQHMFASISRKKWELDSINRFNDICKRVDEDNPFLEPFEQACRDNKPMAIDLNHFGQYASSCLPSVHCESLTSNLFEQLGDGLYSPRPNVKFLCPKGSFCRFGNKVDCPIGFICPEDGMSSPLRCQPSKTNSATCFGSALKSYQPCVKGARCTAPYFPPLLAPPATYGTEDFSIRQCQPGDYCNLGRFALSNDTMGKVCPANFVCPTPDIITPKLCNCSIEYCNYCPAGSFVEQRCPAGFFCQRPDTKVPCNPRFYCPPGSVTQKLCPGKKYCPTPDTAIICPKGYYCPEGSLEPRQCSFLSICPEGIAADQLNFIGVLVVLLAAILLLITYGIYKLIMNRIQKAFAKKRKLARMYEEDLRKSVSIQSGDLGESLLPTTATSSTEYSAPQQSSVFTIDLEFKELGLVVGGGKRVLNGVNGAIPHGNLTAVMGPSGCGKSSFLTTLADLAFYGTRVGKVFINGEEGSLTSFSRLVGFVPQEDIMIRTMTVEETLMFSARTRLDWKKSRAEVTEVVENVIRMLGLDEIRHSIIGDEKNRGISGGQRKRVNIGMELCAQPSVLCLDEPTSGLDSTSSQEVCQALRNIANSGINVITVIHQPRYEIFQMFHLILLLGKGGRTVYLGPSSEVIHYFESIGFKCPPLVNPSDFFLDVIGGTVPCSTKENFHPTDLFDMWETFKLSSEFERLNKSINQQKLQQVSMDVELLQAEPSTSLSVTKQKKSKKQKPSRTISLPLQLVMCTYRAIVQQIRDLSGFFLDNTLVYIAGLFLAITFYKDIYIGPLSEQEYQLCPDAMKPLCSVPLSDPIIKMASYLPLSVALCGVMASLGTFGREGVVFRRESMSGLHPIPYFLGKNLAQIPNILIAPMVFLCVFYSLVSPKSSVFMFYWMMVVLHFTNYGLGYLLSQVFPPSIATLAGVVVALIMNMFSGTTLTLPQMEKMVFPVPIIPVLSYMRWMQEALYLMEIDHYKDLYNIDKGLNIYGYKMENYAKCMILVAVFGIVFRILALALLWASKPDSIPNKIKKHVLDFQGHKKRIKTIFKRK